MLKRKPFMTSTNNEMETQTVSNLVLKTYNVIHNTNWYVVYVANSHLIPIAYFKDFHTLVTHLIFI